MSDSRRGIEKTDTRITRDRAPIPRRRRLAAAAVALALAAAPAGAGDREAGSARAVAVSLTGHWVGEGEQHNTATGATRKVETSFTFVLLGDGGLQHATWSPDGLSLSLPMPDGEKGRLVRSWTASGAPAADRVARLVELRGPDARGDWSTVEIVETRGPDGTVRAEVRQERAYRSGVLEMRNLARWRGGDSFQLLFEGAFRKQAPGAPQAAPLLQVGLDTGYGE